MSHNPINLKVCESLEPCKTAAKLKEINVELKETKTILEEVKASIVDLQEVLYVEHDNKDSLQWQVLQAQALISQLAAKLEINVD